MRKKKKVRQISPGCSLEGLMLKLKLQYIGHLMWRADFWKDPDAGKDWRQKEKGTTEDKMVGWHHQLNGQFGWAPGVSHGQRGLTCCRTWGRKESDTTEQLNWTDCLALFLLHWSSFLLFYQYHNVLITVALNSES